MRSSTMMLNEEGEISMVIPVRVKSKSSGRTVSGVVSPRKLLNLIDETDLIDHLIDCDCSPVGETYVTDCNCDEEWMDCEVLIGDEINA